MKGLKLYSSQSRVQKTLSELPWEVPNMQAPEPHPGGTDPRYGPLLPTF